MINQIILAIILVSGFGIVYGEEPIKITLSDKMDLVKFDGKWSNDTEWKRSSLDRINDDDVNHQIQLRTAHQGDFIYVMIDFVTDETPQKDKDFAIFCLDTLNEKNIQADENDFCFKVFLKNETDEKIRLKIHIFLS